MENIQRMETEKGGEKIPRWETAWALGFDMAGRGKRTP